MAIATAAFAIQPQQWVDNNEADFSEGVTKNTVVTNLGDVKLASDVQVIGEMPEDISVLYDMAALPDGRIFLAGGPKGQVLEKQGETVRVAATAEDGQIFSLAQQNGRLLVAVSSDQTTRICILTPTVPTDAADENSSATDAESTTQDSTPTDGDASATSGTTKEASPQSADQSQEAQADDAQTPAVDSQPKQTNLTTLVELPEVRYVWDLIIDPANADVLYLATGTPGKILKVQLAGEGQAPTITTLLETMQNNVLCLAMHENDLYAGTDTDGLVYRVPTKQHANANGENAQGDATSPNGNDREQADGLQARFADTAAFDGPYVVYDAPEPEIATLLVAKDGTVYAGTADAEQARPGRLEEAVSEQEGRIVPGTASDSETDGDAEGDGDGEDAPQPPDIPNAPPQPEPMDNTGGNAKNAAGQPQSDDAATDADDAETDSTAMDEDEEQQAVETADSEPTSEQRDRLRAYVKQRLMEARKTERLQAGPGSGADNGGGMQGPGSGTASAVRPKPMRSQGPKKQGNAVYRIDPEGFVAEVFRETVMVLKLAFTSNGKQLLIATGNEGQIYRLNPATEETANLVDLESQQVMNMLIVPPAARDANAGSGQVLFCTANPAQLVRMTDGVAAEGTFTSRSFDAEQISLFGMLNLVADLPEGTSVQVQTRTGNVADPEQAPWTTWSEPQMFHADDGSEPLAPRSMKVPSPPARFLQYKLTLAGDGEQTPTIDKVAMTYVMPNLKPVVESLRAEYPDNMRSQQNELSPPSTVMDVQWQASDPNEDRLLYTVQYQPAGSDKWLLMGEDLQQTRFDWQTQRVPDGRYILRLTATDRLDNPPDMARQTVRRSDPLVVDNTPPAIEKLSKTTDSSKITFTGTAADDLTAIRSIGYILDDQESYVQILPKDLIFDSTTEPFSFSIDDLSPGPHVVTVRAVDGRGNARYESILFEVEK